tara:strand:- start:377 stop:637 length:261 start_codon:yes stop_codon:yes gene_type:complete
MLLMQEMDTLLLKRDNFMAEEIKNVVTIDGAEYEERSLEAVSQYLIAQIRDLQTQRGQLQFQLYQKQAALDVMTAKLIESVKPDAL